jgi:hypothetical protein
MALPGSFDAKILLQSEPQVYPCMLHTHNKGASDCEIAMSSDAEMQHTTKLHLIVKFQHAFQVDAGQTLAAKHHIRIMYKIKQPLAVTLTSEQHDANLSCRWSGTKPNKPIVTGRPGKQEEEGNSS